MLWCVCGRQAYVEFGRCMGGVWLEHNMSEMLNHMFSLALNPRASVFHVDAVYARKCVMFMLRSLIGGLLGERAQIAAAKEICLVIVKQMNTLGMTARLHLCSFSYACLSQSAVRYICTRLFIISGPLCLSWYRLINVISVHKFNCLSF